MLKQLIFLNIFFVCFLSARAGNEAAIQRQTAATQQQFGQPVGYYPSNTNFQMTSYPPNTDYQQNNHLPHN